MKRILLLSVPYVLGFLLLNFICYKTSNFYVKQREYTNKIDASLDTKDDIIFLGDSHSETIKKLDLENNVGNLAFGADGIREMYIKSLITAKDNPGAKYVFISTEPQMFNNSLSSNSSFLNPYLISLEDSLDVYDKNSLDLVSESLPLLNDSYLKFYLNKIYQSFKNMGKNGPETNWHDHSDEEKKSIAANTGKMDHNSILTNTNDTLIFRKTVNLLKEQKIKVIGIRFPVYKEYMEQCQQADLERVNEFVESLDLDLHLDYSLAITDPTLFDDEDHLNKKGVSLLAKRIYKDTGVKLEH